MPKFRVTIASGPFFRHHGRAYKPGDVLEMSLDTAAGFPRALVPTKYQTRIPPPFVPAIGKAEKKGKGQKPSA